MKSRGVYQCYRCKTDLYFNEQKERIEVDTDLPHVCTGTKKDRVADKNVASIIADLDAREREIIGTIKYD